MRWPSRLTPGSASVSSWTSDAAAVPPVPWISSGASLSRPQLRASAASRLLASAPVSSRKGSGAEPCERAITTMWSPRISKGIEAESARERKTKSRSVSRGAWKNARGGASERCCSASTAKNAVSARPAVNDASWNGSATPPTARYAA